MWSHLRTGDDSRSQPSLIVLSALFLVAITTTHAGAGDDQNAARNEPAESAPIEIAATVITPDGMPAAHAKVALAEVGAQVVVANGDLDGRATNCPQRETDASGHFQMASTADSFWIVVVHSSGIEQVRCSRMSPPKIIKLQPWARAEGTYCIARRPAADVELDLTWNENLMIGQSAAHLTLNSRQSTNSGGRFVFERVRPGGGFIKRIDHRDMRQPAQMTSTCQKRVYFIAGQTRQIDFGLSGRPVIGRLSRPNAKSVVPWIQLSVFVHADSRVTTLNLTATVDEHGEFCLDDVPPGKYWLSAWFTTVGGGRLLGYRFEVPSVDEKLAQRPVDLGVLQLSEDHIPAARPVKR
jgi:hypothetical protein